jgi:hypothetical protein
MMETTEPVLMVERVVFYRAARCFMFMIVVFDACFWEGGRELTVRRRIPEWKNQI